MPLLSFVLLLVGCLPPETDGPVDTDVDVVDSDAVDSEGLDSDVVDSDPVDSEPPSDTAPPVDSEPPVDTDGLDTDTGFVDSEPPPDTAEDTALVHTDPPVDADGDGVTADLDCDDADPAAFPGAPERCDGRRNDCDRPWPGAEDGLASWEDAAGVFTDVTAAFPTAGVAATWAPPGNGTLWLCPGVHHGRVNVTAGIIAVRGRGGADAVTLDGDRGGSVIFAGVRARLTVEDVTLTDGQATDGGGLRSVEAQVVVRRCVIRGNTASSTGGGLSASTYDEGTLEVVDTRLEDNVAGGDGGGAFVGLVGVSRATLIDLTVARNVARGRSGGGICSVIYDDGALTVQGGSFEDDRVGGPGNTIALGGGLWIDAATNAEIVVGGTTFTRNVALGGATPGAVQGWGGGLGVRQQGPGRVRLVDVAATDNEAGADLGGGGAGLGLGGGVYVVTPTADVLVERPVLSGNLAGLADVYATGGGGLWLGTPSGAHVAGLDWRVAGGRIEGNFAASEGGGVAVRGGDVTLEGVLVAANEATGGGNVAVLAAGDRLDLVGGTVLRGGMAPYGGALGLWPATAATCSGDASATTGLLGNVAYPDDAAVRLSDGATFTAAGCDLGEPGSTGDNTPVDLIGPFGSASYGDDASFSCDATGCR